MVFSTIPAYLDPSNWHQQQQQLQHQQNQGGFHHGNGINNINIPSLTNPNPLLPPPPLPPPRPQPPSQSGPMSLPPGSIRPGSMAERARMANIPMPEMALKCPRCESTNTKFCYFNNYSLSQPRHFCKTCRRYWTRGGALRSVPVGGGCRRNKRSKSSSSKSAPSDRSSSSSAATSSATSSGPHASVAEMMGLTSPPPGLSPLRFMSPLHHLTSDFGEQLGLSSYDGGSGFHHLGSMGSGGSEMYRIPPPFLGGLLDGSSLYGNPFEAVEFSGLAIGGQARSKAVDPAGGEGVKAEERGGEMSLMRRFNMGINNNNNDVVNQGNVVGEENYNWGGGISSSSAWNGHHLNSALNNSSCSNTSAL